MKCPYDRDVTLGALFVALRSLYGASEPVFRWSERLWARRGKA